MNQKKCIEDLPLLILAGGRATRLKHLSENLPKYLMPVAEGKVFADIHLEWVKKQGFKKILLSVGYLGSMVKEYCRDGSEWQLHIEYIDDGDEPLGTGGAVKKSLMFDYLDLAVTYGDTILNFNIEDCLERYIASKALGIMTYYENKVEGHVCNVNPIGNGLIQYNKSQPLSSWLYIDYGFSILSRGLIEAFPKKIPLDLAEPLVAMSQAGGLAGYECVERFWEIGSIDSLFEFQSRS